MTLEAFFQQVPKAAVAFSGGTDSALLLWAARRYGCDVRAYYVKTPFQPRFEYEDARRLARELDVPLTVVELDILTVPEAAANGPQRCYFCKRALFSGLWKAARRDGYTVLLDGTNASDDAGDRPGMRALRELEVPPIRARDLERVERAEAALAALGFRDFRVRLFHGAARIQVTAAQLPLALERREDLTAALRADFSDILLDLAPRAPST